MRLPAESKKIQAALDDLDKGKYASIRQAAAAHGCSRSTLTRRKSGTIPRQESNLSLRRISPAMEEELVEWITRLRDANKPPNQSMIVEKVAQLFRARGDTRPVGKNLVSRLIKRNERIHNAMRDHSTSSPEGDENSAQVDRLQDSRQDQNLSTYDDRRELAEILKRVELLQRTLSLLQDQTKDVRAQIETLVYPDGRPQLPQVPVGPNNDTILSNQTSDDTSPSDRRSVRIARIDQSNGAAPSLASMQSTLRF